MPDRIDQTGNIVYGNQSGRDTNIHNYAPPTVPQLHRLYQAYEEEAENSSDFDGYIDALLRYVSSVDEGVPLSLEDKLRLGGREAEVPRALRQKEEFQKKLMRLRLSKTAQKVLAFLLSRVDTQFRYSIRPHIDLGMPQVEVDHRVLTEIIENVREMLGLNPLEIDDEEICGMIYYLTGNCHIRWDAVA